MMINDYYFHLRFRGGEAELEENDPSHYMYVTEGKVIGVDEADREADVGRFRLFYLDVCAAMNAGASVFEIFDYSQPCIALNGSRSQLPGYKRGN